VVTELIDGVAGLLAAVMLASLSFFRMYSVLVTSHEPMLLLGLLLVWAWLRWRRHQHWRWALAMGVFAGWGAITRPADAVCFALPVGLAMLLDLFRGTGVPPVLRSARAGAVPRFETASAYLVRAWARRPCHMIKA
jgi:4-amino-4-deoxy-L-arabinose transferase-like glycosyltransferase